MIGISKDTSEAHQKFIEKNNLPFLLLSDTERAVLQAYDVWKEKNMYGKKVMGVVRTTYIIDPEGKIQKVFPKVKPDTNAMEILDYFKNLSKKGFLICAQTVYRFRRPSLTADPYTGSARTCR